MKAFPNYQKSLLLTVVLLAGPHTWAASSREEIDETRQVRENETISIEVMSGEVRIRAEAGNTFRVSGVLDEEADGYTLESSNGLTRFEVDMPPSTHPWGRGNNGNHSELDIVVPLNSDVEFDGVNVNIDISGVSGGSQIETVNGDIQASDLSDFVELSTVNGSISNARSSGRVEISTVNGHIEDNGSVGRIRYSAVNGSISVDSRADEVGLEVVNGDVRASLQETHEIELSNVNGSIEVTLHDSLAPRISGDSVSGDITLNLDPAIEARFSLRTTTGGRIINHLTSDEATRTGRFVPGSRLDFVAGQGGGVVELTTLSGRLELNSN